MVDLLSEEPPADTGDLENLKSRAADAADGGANWGIPWLVM